MTQKNGSPGLLDEAKSQGKGAAIATVTMILAIPLLGPVIGGATGLGALAVAVVHGWNKKRSKKR